MRLVCPNCDAEYEVDVAAIPDAGRDVQCSNCGHAWFQMSPRVEEELAAEEALFDAPPPLGGVAGDYSEDENDMARPMPAAQPRALDESVLAVLREEAERETAARRVEAPPALEMQDDLGLSAAVAATVAATVSGAVPSAADADPVAARIARMKGEPIASAKPQSRREMLPEIDEINTTLRASTERRSGEAGAVQDSMTATGGRSAFRSGFVLMMLLAVLIVALYVMAPKLSQQIPGLEGALTGYVAMIDAARMALDNLLKGAAAMIRGTADGS